ncbi:hypothetical protein FRC07_011631 [Ceratobasidium sp. 392]|nr:hypothetical protein FRC07_011631 [Ceratobasidium sp. 392]
MSSEYIKCARIVQADDPTADYEFIYEVKWAGSADDPSVNTWEKEEKFGRSSFIDDFWGCEPKPTSEPDEEGVFGLGSMFEATREYIAKQILLGVAAQLPKSPARPVKTVPTLSYKRLRSPSSEDNSGPTSRRRRASPLEDEPLAPPPRPMVRPTIGSVLTFKKGGKAFVQDKNRQVQDYRAFRRRGGIYWQQYQRKERERRLAEAKKKAEEAAEAAAKEARRIAEALHEAEEMERIAEEERMAIEAEQIVAEANERARRAAEWDTPRPEPPRKPSPPPLKDLLANALDDDDLPDFEDDETEPAIEAKPVASAATSIFGGSNTLLGGDSKPAKKKIDPYYWANELDEKRKHKELMSRHPRFKLLAQLHGELIDVFIKDITNEPPRPPKTPTVAILADTIIDGITMQEEVESAITGVERGWSPARSVARLAPVNKAHWATLEVLALELLVEGKVIVGDQNADGWRPIVFASEEEGIFKMLGASEQLAGYKSTLLMTMVKTES